MFTVDFSIYDQATAQLCASMYYFFENTIDESLHTATAEEQQTAFLDGLNAGALDDDILALEDPAIYEICPVLYSETDLAVGVAAAVITNIVLRPSMKAPLPAIRAAVLENSPETQINVYYRNV